MWAVCTLLTSKDTKELPIKQIRTKCFPWKTGTNKRHTSRQSAATSYLFSATAPLQQNICKIPLQQLYEKGGTIKAYLNSVHLTVKDKCCTFYQQQPSLVSIATVSSFNQLKLIAQVKPLTGQQTCFHMKLSLAVTNLSTAFIYTFFFSVTQSTS